MFLKKLDKLVIRAFLGPFTATFFITLLVLVMQFFWLYIDDFVGKGLGPGVIAEFILYQSAVLVPLALPLSVLLSSLMTFGNLGESFELVAIKSAGISLIRFMRPLFWITALISGVAFLFSNYIIPVANLKSRTLLADIIYAKPAFDLKEGVFYDKINGYAIKIGKKESDSLIRDVVIYEQGNILQDNFLVAESGIMRVTGNKRILEFRLRNGWRYQERGNAFEKENTEYVRIGFKEFNKQFDLSSLGFTNRTADSVNKNNERMYSMRQLGKAIDSLRRDNDQYRARFERDAYRSLEFKNLYDSIGRRYNDSLNIAVSALSANDQWLPDSARETITNLAKNAAVSVKIGTESQAGSMREKERVYRKHLIEWHRKIVLSLACLVLFLVGAPLGSIIRKGGLGTPLIFAILFFMVYYFISTTGEKMAKEDTITPFGGMWLATCVLSPIGIFLTYKALNDAPVLSSEFYSRLKEKWKSRFRTQRSQ
ncbi:MAG: LptF/LptG family permease [Bacteroidota bacterium]